MPTDLDYSMYFNLIFFGVIGLGALFGYLRGFKKSLYTLIIMIIFYAVFFFTIDLVVENMWNSPVTGAFASLESTIPGIGSANTMGEALSISLNEFLGDTLTAETLENARFLALVTGIVQFVLKLGYTLIYFTVGYLAYRFITLIVRLIFFGDKKRKKGEKKPSKRRLMGAVAGGLRGSLSAFVALIMIGGVMNIMESTLSLVPQEAPENAIYLEPIYLSNVHPEFVAMDNPSTTTEQEDAINFARILVSEFNDNMFVKASRNMVIEDNDYSEPVALDLFLFDSVLSFDIKGSEDTDEDQTVYLRKELASIARVGSIFIESDFAETNNLSDITRDEVVGSFNALAESNFIVSIMPLAIEVGSDYADVDVDMPTDDLYAIDWKAELSTLGAIAGVGFDILNNAGMFEENPDYETVVFDGDDVQGLFNSLADSELATLGAYIAVEPLLQSSGGNLSAIITVPEDLEWEDEFRAFGLVAKEILDQEITLADLQNDDPTTLVTTMAGVDFTVLLDSKLVSHALKNIFSGDAGIEGLDMFVVPDNVVWFDELDNQGEVVVPGELRNILSAINAIIDVVGEDDFSLTEIDINVIADFDDPTVDTIFESLILVATISDYLLNMDLGDTPLIIPDSTLDANDYILKIEMKRVVKSAKVLVTDLACDEGDTACEDGGGFDFGKAFSLTDTSIDTLLDSDILGASIGQVIIDQAGDSVTIPVSAKSSILVDGVATEVISKIEVKNMFKAVNVLNITDMENINVDASIINELAEDDDPTTLDNVKAQKIYNSKILHATISKMLFDQTDTSDTLVVPELKQDGFTKVVNYVAIDDLRYVSTDELDAILQALITLDISDFEEMNSLDLQTVIDNSATLLESAILQATISKQLLDLGTETIQIPYVSPQDQPIRIVVDEGTSKEVTYIDKDELIHTLDALEVIGMTKVDGFDGQVLLTPLYVESNRDILFDSAIMQATFSKQVIDMEGTQFDIPNADVLGQAIKTTHGVGIEEFTYITEDELSALILVMELFGVTDVQTFDGAFSFEDFSTDEQQNTLLDSAIVHYTVSKEMLDLTDDVLIVPTYNQDGVDPANEIVKTVSSFDFIVKDEVKAIINALNVLGFTDAASATEINSEDFFTHKAVLLQSVSLQATISDNMINKTGDVLIVPNINMETLEEVRITVDGYEFVDYDEIMAILQALELLGLTDFDNMNFTPANVFNVDFETLLESAAIQATISDTILPNSVETAPNGTTQLIIPAYFKEAITVGVNPATQVEYDELLALLNGLKALDVQNFDGAMSGSTITDLSGNDIDILLLSGSIHTTIDNMLRGNSFVTNNVHPLTMEDDLAYKSDILKVVEIKAFIMATKEISASDFTSVSFDASILSTVSSASSRDVIFSSMLIRNELSDDVVALAGVSGYTPFPIPNTYYMNDDNTSYLRKTEFLDIVEFVYPASS
jgi:hypothetical protein